MKQKLRMGTNTKMYMGIAQTTEYLERLGRLTRDLDRAVLDLFVIPSFTALDVAGRLAAQQGILLGAQNMAWEDEGPFTGEVSPLMLREVGASIAEIGHSERRHILHETDEMANQKVHAALRHGMTALLCVGETQRQKERGLADEVLRTQLKEGLYGVEKNQAVQVWVAYEPVWAIGAEGQPASAEYAEEKHRVIHDTLLLLFGDASEDIPVLYGGSVNPQNAAGLIAMPHIDGLFVGRSAWDAQRFAEMLRAVLPVFLEK